MLIEGWTSGLDMQIEGDSLSMKDLGMDLSIIEGYLGEQQTQRLSSLTRVLSDQVDEVIVPNCRLPSAD